MKLPTANGNKDSKDNSDFPIICVVGPTASGKTTLAQALALYMDGEVISADSMQVYKGMNIGTGKIKPHEQKVVHHGLDLVDPGYPFSAALYQQYARSCFSDIAQRNKCSVLCGGTGLYVRAAIDDYEFPQGNQTENPTRERYTLFAEQQGGQALWDELQKCDPDSAALIHPNNVRRVIRAFEMIEEQTSYSQQHARLQKLPQALPALFLGLSVSPEILIGRIDRRVDAMMEEGLVDEVKTLLQLGFHEAVTAHQAIGYKEIVGALEGQTTMSDAVERIKIATRRYAKRQRTWFRRDERIQWLDADSGDAKAVLAQALEALVSTSKPDVQ